MSDLLTVWFPGYYTEAHRTPDRQTELVNAFKEAETIVKQSLFVKADAIFSGSIYTAPQVRQVYMKNSPTVFYNWDLYPWIIENQKQPDWLAYIQQLRQATVVAVPNEGTRIRTMEYTGRDAVIVKSPVRTWEIPKDRPPNVPTHLSPGNYVVNVMRDYVWDKGWYHARSAANWANVEIVETMCKMPWDAFRWVIGNAGALLSTCDEASTGGLTLLEGYAHGVPIIISDSPMNGANEYFQDRQVFKFNHRAKDPVTELAEVIKTCLSSPRLDPATAMKWVKETYSDARFAQNLKSKLSSAIKVKKQR